jgi:hypothetical protein
MRKRRYYFVWNGRVQQILRRDYWTMLTMRD